MYPSYRRTASIISLSAGSMIARASSGSRSCSSSVDPLISANSAVTVLRSPSAAMGAVGSDTISIDGAEEVRADDFDTSEVSGAAHSSQNFASGALGWVHLGQMRLSGVAH